MTPSFEAAVQALKKLPGVGYRSAERIALNLLVESPHSLENLTSALQLAAEKVRACSVCGNIAEESLCSICQNAARDPATLCIVETVSDLHSLEQSGAFSGHYHVLHGKLSPIKGIHPEDLNIASLHTRFEQGQIQEVILALSNDIEGQATCHYLQESVIPKELTTTLIAHGIPTGAAVTFADASTLRSALEGRRSFARVSE